MLEVDLEVRGSIEKELDACKDLSEDELWEMSGEAKRSDQGEKEKAL